MFGNVYKGKKVLITGHTGFKGSWLCLWLHTLGAKVTGYALDPPTNPSMFKICRIDEIMTSISGDVRDLALLKQALSEATPEIVIHMAAQAIVRESYNDPLTTFSTNIMGTVNLLEAVRHVGSVRAVIVVTTDKCYENRDGVWGYRENEPLGGHDPYSSSKACAELITAAYRRSFFGVPHRNSKDLHQPYLATARAGNVIGGGDWARDRLIPDYIRALVAGEKILIRYPLAVRPWQHVLEPLGGYLILAAQLSVEGAPFAEAWNFGPSDEDARSVGWVVERIAKTVPGFVWEKDKEDQPHEASYLRLDSSKARIRLGWRHRWSLETALDKTMAWYEAWRQGKDMRGFSIRQIADYENSEEAF
jgi:CDP-glucose 4,6-dehydratase